MAAGHLLTNTMVERIRNYAALGEAKEPVLVQAPMQDEFAAPRPPPAEIV